MTILPVGKLPPGLLEKILHAAEVPDCSVVTGPGVGLDCAVVRPSDDLLVIKSDPITFATSEIGWYAVQVNANDIATTGARPCWFMATVLLPEGSATGHMTEDIMGQIQTACRELDVSLIGGHTEITHGLNRPIIAGTMLGQVAANRLIQAKNARSGDSVLLTKGVPIEATAILAREYPQHLADKMPPEEIALAADYLHNPGISVLKDARIALSAGRVSYMHDPTEGGLAAALWEMAQACGKTVRFSRSTVAVDELGAKICKVFDLDPLATIASGSLLIAVRPEDAEGVCRALLKNGIACRRIAELTGGPSEVLDMDAAPDEHGKPPLLPWPQRDEIGKAFGK